MENVSSGPRKNTSPSDGQGATQNGHRRPIMGPTIHRRIPDCGRTGGTRCRPSGPKMRGARFGPRAAFCGCEIRIGALLLASGAPRGTAVERSDGASKKGMAGRPIPVRCGRPASRKGGPAGGKLRAADDLKRSQKSRAAAVRMQVNILPSGHFESAIRHFQ